MADMVRVTLPDGRREVIPLPVWKQIWKRETTSKDYDVEDVIAAVKWTRLRPRDLSAHARLGYEGEKLFISDSGRVIMIDDLMIRIFPNLDSIEQYLEARAY